MGKNFDVVVVGSGIAGSACAAFIAEAKMRVALVDQRRLARAGPRWVNGVPRDAFVAAKIALPVAPELRSEGAPFVIASPSGDTRVRLAEHPVLDVDMRLLGDRLRSVARNAGAELFEEARVDEVELDGKRPIAISTSRGELRAHLFVDATGLPAVIRRAVFPHWPDVPSEHICLAAQEVRLIIDDEGAKEFLHRRGVAERETFSTTGTHGGFSVLNVHIDRSIHEVSLLAGAIRSSGASMIDDFCDRNPWVGVRRFGGAGALPIRRPYSRLVSPGLAILGDAACQMFPAHGSGIAIGLRAARLLADTVVTQRGHPERAGDEDALWHYAMRFHRQYSGILYAYDRIRRFTQGLSRDESEQLFAVGLATPRTLLSGLSQELPHLSPTMILEAIDFVRGAFKAPNLAGKVARALAAIPICRSLARTYPRRPDVGALARYERRAAHLVGDAVPDPVE